MLRKVAGMGHEALLPLEFLGAGEWAEVAEVTGEASLVCRLAEMGVRAGCRLCMLQPGSPCLFQLGGSRLSLRSGMHILVRPMPSSACTPEPVSASP